MNSDYPRLLHLGRQTGPALHLPRQHHHHPPQPGHAIRDSLSTHPAQQEPQGRLLSPRRWLLTSCNTVLHWDRLPQACRASQLGRQLPRDCTTGPLRQHSLLSCTLGMATLSDNRHRRHCRILHFTRTVPGGPVPHGRCSQSRHVNL